MSYNIIVARYNENIDWLKDELENSIIYNKGDKLNIHNEILLENVGRESETYLHYIITNYENLPDVVVFTQARISDSKRNSLSDDIDYLIDIKNQAVNNSKSQNFLTFDDKHYDWGEKWNFRNGNFYLNNNYKNNKPIFFIDWFKEHININYPNPIHVYCNAIFAVRKEHILNNPIEYYKKLILEVNHHINSTEGHFFERSWYYIFN